MRTFTRHSPDCSTIYETVEVSHPFLLGEADGDSLWTELPNPQDFTVGIVGGEVAVIAAVVPEAKQVLLRKAELLAAIKGQRDLAEASGCATPYGPVDTTPESQRKLGGAATAALALGAAFSKRWRMADNTLTDLDAAKMITMGLTVVAHVDACQQHKNALDEAVEAAASLAELDAIDVGAGWPS